MSHSYMIRQHIGTITLLLILLVAGCSSEVEQFAARSASEQEVIRAQLQEERRQKAASLADVTFVLNDEAVPPESTIPVKASFASSNPELFDASSPELFAKVFRNGDVIEWESELSVTLSEGVYTATGDVRSPPREGEYEVRLIYSGTSDVVAKAPLTVKAVE